MDDTFRRATISPRSGRVAMVGRSFRMAFWVLHDHLGKFVVYNLMGMLLLAPVSAATLVVLGTGNAAQRVLFGLPLCCLAGGLIFPLLAVGFSEMVAEAVRTHDIEWRGFLRGVRGNAFRAMGAGLVLTLVGCSLVTAIGFYTLELGSVYPVAGYLLGALSLWGVVLLVPVYLLIWPALVQRRSGLFPTLKLTLWLVFDNPLLSMGLVAGSLGVFTLALLPPMWLVFSVAPLLVLSGSAYEMLARKYAPEARQQPPPPEAEDDYLNRGLRDLMCPWKS